MEFYIRPVRRGDAEDINRFRRMPGVYENILATPSERLESTEAFLTGLDANAHVFAAVKKMEDGSELVIGLANLHVYPGVRQRHSAGIGIMVHREYQEQGAGTRLLETLIDMADNWLMLVRVELGVYTDNQRAIRLYKRFGFEEEGVKRMAAVRHGKYVDELVMARIRPDLLPANPS